jgi:protein gp37
MACDYCYARAMYKRFKWDEKIRFDWSVANDIAKIKEPSRIFWGSTIELFGKWIDPAWMRLIFDYIKEYCPQHTHIFLTKQPQNLIQYSPFPENVWVGYSATNPDMFINGLKYMSQIKATVKFVSLEPLLD